MGAIGGRSERAFYLYYSVGDCRAGKNHHLRVAIANAPEGPYTDTGTPLLVPDDDEVFVFDTHPFQDTDGSWYLLYNRNYLAEDPETNGRAGDAIVMRRLLDMTCLSTEFWPVTRPFADWQRGPGRVYNGVPVDWHTNEGGCVVLRNGVYYCFYSGSAWHTANYGVDYVISDRITGPYRSDNPNETPRVLRAIPDVLHGPGHNTLVTGPDGKTDYIVFHAWDEAMQNRQMYIEPIAWTNDGPRLAC